MEDINGILIIRRDNIGDLVCTTPAIRALRERYPNARLCVLANSYNADVVKNNPDVDEVYVYEKAKHAVGKSAFKVYAENVKVMLRIRGEKFDVAVACSYGYSARLARYAYMTGARNKIGYVSETQKTGIYNFPIPEPTEPIHEVEAMMQLIEPLGAGAVSYPMTIIPDGAEVKKAEEALRKSGIKDDAPPVVFVISSRKTENRWPVDRFKELGDEITGKLGKDIVLMWSPGAADNPFHPGDDEKAAWLTRFMKKRPVSYRTSTLKELIAMMSLSSIVVCCDGGAMHIAAALKKPVLTVWGSTDRRRWAPWGVPHIILQNGADASRVGVKEAFEAFQKLSF